MGSFGNIAADLGRTYRDGMLIPADNWPVPFDANVVQRLWEHARVACTPEEQHLFGRAVYDDAFSTTGSAAARVWYRSKYWAGLSADEKDSRADESPLKETMFYYYERAAYRAPKEGRRATTVISCGSTDVGAATRTIDVVLDAGEYGHIRVKSSGRSAPHVRAPYGGERVPPQLYRADPIKTRRAMSAAEQLAAWDGWFSVELGVRSRLESAFGETHDVGQCGDSFFTALGLSRLQFVQTMHDQQRRYDALIRSRGYTTVAEYLSLLASRFACADGIALQAAADHLNKTICVHHCGTSAAEHVQTVFAPISGCAEKVHIAAIVDATVAFAAFAAVDGPSSTAPL